MSLAVRINISGDKETITKLQKLGQSLVMLQGAMNDIGKELTDYYGNQVFASRGGIIGENWDDLSPVYKLSKAKKFPGRSPLVKTGAMQKSFIYEATHDSVTIANSADYFAYHQSDEPRTSNLPRRQMMKVTPDIKKLISQIIDQDINEKIKRAGL